MFDDEDLSLLEGLTEEELQQLSFTVDPEQSLLEASERCSYKRVQPETRMYEREHLMDFMEKLAGSKVPKGTYIPHEKKGIEPPAPVRRPSPLPSVQLSTEEAEELSQMSETELIELAAYIGATNLLTQDQIHAVEIGKKPEGTMKKTVVKSSIPTSVVSMDPEQDLDVITLKKHLKEGNSSVITINNIPELEGDAFDEILMSLDENSALKHLSLANTGMSDRIARSFVESIACNNVLETLNLESNYVSPETLLELIKVIGQNKTLRELRIANQKVRLGLKYEDKIANALENNHTLLRIGLTIENAGPRNKIDRFLIRNNDQLRKARNEGKQAYNFNDVKATIKNAKQPWLKQRGIFKTGELRLSSNDGEDGSIEPMSRLKKTGYNYEKERERPIVNLYEEEGITAEEAAQVYQQQMEEGIEKQAKQSDMLGELTQMLAKRNSRLAAAAVETEANNDIPATPVLQPPHQIKQPKPISPARELQMSMQAEMAAALEERQKKIIEQGEKDDEEEDAEREERRNRRRGRGRRRNDDANEEEERDEKDNVSTNNPEIEEVDGPKEDVDDANKEGPRRRRQRQRYPSEDDETLATISKDPDAEKPTTEDVHPEIESRNSDKKESVNVETSDAAIEDATVTNTVKDKSEVIKDEGNAEENKMAAEDMETREGNEEEGSSRRQRRRRNTSDDENKEEENSGKRGRDRKEVGEDEDEDERAERRRRQREERGKDQTRSSRRSRRDEKEEDEEISDQVKVDKNNNESNLKIANEDKKEENKSGIAPIQKLTQPIENEPKTISSNQIPTSKSLFKDDDIGRPMSLRERRRLKEMAGQ